MSNWFSKHKKRITWILILILIVVLFLIFGLGQGDQNDLVLHQVNYQDLNRYLFETGTVKQGEEVLLSFNQGGRLKQLSVQEGDTVSANQTLAALERTSLLLERSRAEESLAMVQADYQKLMAGLSAEELKYYQTSLVNAETALVSAEAALSEVQEEAEEVEELLLAERSQIYSSAINDARQAVEVGLNSLFFVTDLQTQYFAVGTQDSLRLAGAKARAAYSLLGENNAHYWSRGSLAQQYGGARGLVIEAESNDQIEEALQALILALQDIRDALDAVTINQISNADLALLHAENTTINNTLAGLTTHQKIIHTHWVASQNSLNAAQRAVQAAERQVQTARGSYDLALAQWEMQTSSPREEDRQLYEARIRQAEADLKLIDQRLSEMVLKAPFEGQVIEINRFTGETVQPGQAVLRLRPAAAFQVEAEVYEGDIGKIRLGQSVQVELIAFPDEVINGRVVLINPATRIINNIVYYPVVIELDETFEGLKAGLTADVKFVLESRENVLTVPESAITTKEGRSIVRLYQADGLIEEREVIVGVRGEEFRVEIISGLEAGDQVIAR
ncbi:MAG: efflux RND transporter periplasmic adaptor subunit [Dehalococcoidales bacterium]|nr:efflux RND transporter periplasmic adaptor subunit [Dehalococcoidales bacterium]